MDKSTRNQRKPIPKKQDRARSSAGRPWLLWLGAILVLTFVVYIPSLDNDFVWDDDLYVSENPLVTHPNAHALLTTPVGGNYHPLTVASLALNYRISGLNTASYHWLNLLLHLANTGLVFLFIRQLSKGRLWTTVVTSLFFGVHPMHVESVAWIAERKDVLYAFFYLIGLIAYLWYVDRRQRPWLGVAVLAFVMSSASKPAAVVFPLALLAIDYIRKRPFKISVALEKVPFLAVSLVDGILTLSAQQGSGAITNLWNPFQKLLFATYGTVMYVAKLLVPVRLSAIYPYPSPRTGLGPEYYVAFAAASVLVPAILYLSRHNRSVQFGLAFYFINIILVLQLITVGGAVMADRYTYLAYIGLLFASAWWLDESPNPGRAGLRAKPVLAGIFLVLLPVSMLQTWKRADVWQNAGTLWSDTIQKHPGQCADAYVNRGNYYLRHGKRFEAALADFNQALALNSRTSGIWNCKGNALTELGRYDSALACYDRAIKLNPSWGEALNSRGAAKLRKGDAAGSVADFSRAIGLNATGRQAYANRAIAYIEMREYEGAISDCRRAVELDPKSPDTYIQFGTIGFAEEQLNRHRMAITDFDEAIRLSPPGEPRLGAYYLYRSYARSALGDRTGALNDAREAQRLGTMVEPAYIRQLGG
ncbi:MAG: tetratricopeptide repeat protein [Candidatus Eisenbacteria bacterium]|uniref:Tetratricopeptide repeat protein n=1 Tax=Eiseniibacteriota bacterium TaxID=2212470 RepID=A0A538SWV0_UNCEI|nr:MAG: tetratricopeptide repeat protein [Candidatus Eisenbacteria bacterium]